MNNQQLRTFLIKECEESGHRLPSDLRDWGEYIDGGILDIVLDDLDRYAPNWSKLSPEAFSDLVERVEVPDYRGHLSSLIAQWQDHLVPF